MSKQYVWFIKVCEIEATPTNGTILPVSQLECGVAFGDTEILVLNIFVSFICRIQIYIDGDRQVRDAQKISNASMNMKDDLSNNVR